MGRSSRSQADQNRARILQVASGLFRAHGVEAVGIADVMKAAGMTQGGFYKHFPSKDALAAEACALAFEGAAENWRRVARDAAADGRNVAAAIADYYVAPKPPGMTCPMIAFAPDAARRGPDDPLHRTFSDGVRGLFDTFSELAGGAAASPEAEERLRTLFAAMIGSNMLARSGPGEEWSTAFGRSVLAASAAIRSGSEPPATT